MAGILRGQITALATNKLINANANFVAGDVGKRVWRRNAAGSGDLYATVTAVDNATRLSLSGNIFLGAGDNYYIFNERVSPPDYFPFTRLVELFRMCSVRSATMATRPLAPIEGDRYIVPTAGWGGLNARDIAIFIAYPGDTSAGWYYQTAYDGMIVNVEDTGRRLQFNIAANAWIDFSVAGTTSQSFQLQSGLGGARLKNNAGVVEARNAADNAFTNVSGSRYLWQGKSSVKANMSANQIITTATWTRVAFNAKSEDTNNEYDHITNFRFVANTARRVRIVAQIGINIGADQVQASVRISRNGVAVRRSTIFTSTPVATPISISIPSVTIALAHNDFLEIFVHHERGSNATVDASAELSFFEVEEVL